MAGLDPCTEEVRQDKASNRRQRNSNPFEGRVDGKNDLRICNNGWMSTLESDNIPIIGSMFNDLSIPLDESQQKTVAAWAVKTSMVVDSRQGRAPGNRFYRKPECEAMRLTRTIPYRTRVWISRSLTLALTAAGTHVKVFSPEIPARTPEMIVTIVVGHLAIQVFRMHVDQEHADLNISDPDPAPGDWDNLLTQIWPNRLQYVMWSPKETSTRGVHNAIGTLTDRWRMGEEVPYGLLRRG